MPLVLMHSNPFRDSFPTMLDVDIIDGVAQRLAYGPLVTVCTIEAPTNDRVADVVQAQTESRRQFVLFGVVREGSLPGAADALRTLGRELRNVLRATARSPLSTSPLWAALTKLNASFSKSTAYGESLFAYSEASLCVLDVATHQMHAVSFGPGAQPAHLVDATGANVEPTSRRMRFSQGVTITDITFGNLCGTQRVVLGSPGLWCDIPRTCRPDPERHPHACEIVSAPLTLACCMSPIRCVVASADHV